MGPFHFNLDLDLDLDPNPFREIMNKKYYHRSAIAIAAL